MDSVIGRLVERRSGRGRAGLPGHHPAAPLWSALCRLAAARGWLGQSMATLKEMRRLGMSPVRADVNEEQVRALLARSGAGAGG